MQLLEDDDDDEDDSASAQRSDGRPAWMRSLLESARTWMGLLPDSLVTLRRTIENIEDPLYRFFEREVNSDSKLSHDLRQDPTKLLKMQLLKDDMTTMKMTIRTTQLISAEMAAPHG
jgi:hypothetical protein